MVDESASGRIAPSAGKQPAPQFLGLRNRCGALAVYLREELLSIEAHADLDLSPHSRNSHVDETAPFVIVQSGSILSGDESLQARPSLIALPRSSLSFGLPRHGMTTRVGAGDWILHHEPLVCCLGADRPLRAIQQRRQFGYRVS